MAVTPYNFREMALGIVELFLLLESEDSLPKFLTLTGRLTTNGCLNYVARIQIYSKYSYFLLLTPSINVGIVLLFDQIKLYSSLLADYIKA